MKNVLFALTALVLAALGLVTVPAMASAAPCQPAIVPLDTAVQRSDAIVVGKVVTVGQKRADAATVRVSQTVKGSASGQITIHVITTTCNVAPLRQGTTYLFFLVRHREGWNARDDMPNTSKDIDATVGKVKAILNPPPAQPPSVAFSDPLLGAPRPYWQVALPGFALVALALVGLVTLAATRRRTR